MTVPLDNYYNFLDDIIDRDILIYHYAPHGSKSLTDLLPVKPISSMFTRITTPIVIAHDQEPLNFTGYTYHEIVNVFADRYPDHWLGPILKNKYKRMVDEKNPWKDQFINLVDMNLYNGYVLLHSEKNSTDLDKYIEAGAVPAYYWSHAMIARDWFRYAQIDPRVGTFKNIKKDFLIYNRAWSGTREYRLKFTELVATNNLNNHCVMNFSKFDSDKNYQHHNFVNQNFKISTDNLESYFLSTAISSNASASYVSDDYNSCLLEVVLETVYDGQRIHLTEKSLRPISCKMPFIIAGGPGSLQYLRDYGFKTFDSYWDESYDKINDSAERLESIVHLMKKISALSECEKHHLYLKTREICEHNHRLFFSDAFSMQIVQEYKHNVNTALNQLPRAKEQLVAKIDSAISNITSMYPGTIDKYYTDIISLSEISAIRNLP
jgi:hypothetical protein